MIVKLKTFNSEYTDLSPFHWYVVIGVEADDLRILNDQGRPYLYPQSLFAVVDANEPADWITDFGAEGERYAYPAEMNAPGFFEDFFGFFFAVIKCIKSATCCFSSSGSDLNSRIMEE